MENQIMFKDEERITFKDRVTSMLPPAKLTSMKLTHVTKDETDYYWIKKQGFNEICMQDVSHKPNGIWLSVNASWENFIKNEPGMSQKHAY